MKEIKTDRLVIRRFTADDWRDLYEYLSDKKVVQYEPYDIFTEEECKQEAVNRSSNDAFGAVCLKDNNKVIGNIYFEKQNFDTWELGYVFNSHFQGKGYATESSKAIVDYAFHELNARRIIAGCDIENSASWKLLERLNMRREAYQKKSLYFKVDSENNPIWIDSLQYAILSEEWFNKD